MIKQFLSRTLIAFAIAWLPHTKAQIPNQTDAENKKQCLTGNVVSCEKVGIDCLKNHNLFIYFESGCARKHGFSCRSVGQCEEVKNLFSDAAHYYKMGCQLKDQHSCLLMDRLQIKLKSECNENKKESCSEVDFNDLEAQKYYRIGCDKKDGNSCRQLGGLLEKQKNNINQAANSYKEGCDLGDNPSCDFLHYIKTKSVPLEAFSSSNCKDATNWKEAMENKWLRKVLVQKMREGKLKLVPVFHFQPKSVSNLIDKSRLINGSQIEFEVDQSDGQEFGIAKVDCKKGIITFWETDASGDTLIETIFNLDTGTEIIGKPPACLHGC